MTNPRTTNPRTTNPRTTTSRTTAPRMATLLGRMRGAAQRFGVDVTRYPDPAAYASQLVRLLAEFEVDLVLDAGAHAGRYAGGLRRAGYGGRMVSFEPLDGPRRRLERAAAQDDAWSVLPYALGDESGPAVLNVAGDDGAASSVLPMLPRHREAHPRSAYVDRQPVEMRRLDELWEQVVAPGERVFLRLDVRGYESRVLRGAGEYTGDVTGLQLQTSFVPDYADGPLFAEALDLAQSSLGLSLKSLVPGAADPRSGELLQCGLVLLRP
ncbi:FkbM family methyltransferase [Streptomyces sp. B-S-A8]|uniref:FkbM family methyltransferase n=1 Tax=Streptomyces solicavernae TaxID=3043614 RepID=A0ABT6RJU2_9ACTN|nr:FkbM family methyltransferase [Streptomyces sp. B-S-A8]MDI3384689.1 FkbM family methyltransferase [Streptomyces sp. B-S-A8]